MTSVRTRRLVAAAAATEHTTLSECLEAARIRVLTGNENNYNDARLVSPDWVPGEPIRVQGAPACAQPRVCPRRQNASASPPHPNPANSFHSGQKAVMHASAHPRASCELLWPTHLHASFSAPPALPSGPSPSHLPPSQVFSKFFQNWPAAIAYPRTNQQAAAAVQCALQYGVNVHPRCGGHGNEGAPAAANLPRGGPAQPGCTFKGSHLCSPARRPSCLPATTL